MGGPELSEKMMLKPRPEREARASQTKDKGKHIPEGKNERGDLHAAQASAGSWCGQRGVTKAESNGSAFWRRRRGRVL